MINCPGPYSYDGRDKGRRAGITQQQRARVTYSLSWVSVRDVCKRPALLLPNDCVYRKSVDRTRKKQCKTCRSQYLQYRTAT